MSLQTDQELKQHFHSNKCYERYLYGVSLAKQVNDYLGRGYLVLDEENQPITDKFIFIDSENKPTISSGGIEYTYYHYNDDSKIWMHNDDGNSKKGLKIKFSMLKIVHPKHFSKISF